MINPQLFHLQRDRDVTGASGTGRVAEGVAWPDGSASVWWHGADNSIVYWPKISSAKAKHGHDGATRFVWFKDPHGRLARIAEAHEKYVTTTGMTNGDCAECGQAWPCPTYAWATEERDPMACWDPTDDEDEGNCGP